MKKNFARWTLVSIFLFALAKLFAQDAYMGYDYNTSSVVLAWPTSLTYTFNTAQPNELLLNISEFKAGQTVCGEKIDVAYMGGSSSYVDINLTANSDAMLIGSVVFTGSTNKDYEGSVGVLYSDKYPYDETSIIAAESSDPFPAASGSWREVTITPPAEAKSLRINKKLTYDGTDYGDNTSIRLASVTVYLVARLATPTVDPATSVTSSGFTANWQTVTSAQSYVVNLYKNSSVVDTKTVASTDLSVAFSGLTDNTTYSYTVTAIGDGTTNGDSFESSAETVRTLNTEKAITSFTLAGSAGVIDETAKTITVEVSYSVGETLPASMTPVVVVSDYATYSPTGAQTFSVGTAVATYTVTAEDGSTQPYTINITQAAASQACNLTMFSFNDVSIIETVDINQTTQEITVTVNQGADYTSVDPIIGISSLASITSPSPLTGIDFSSTVSIVVQAEDVAYSKTYTVNVVEDGTAPVIQSAKPALDGSDLEFSLAGVMKLNYDEVLYTGTGSITLKTGSTDVSSAIGTITLVDSLAKINFSGLASLTEYTLTIPAGMFTDLYGNAIASTTITFKTADDTNHSTWYASYMDGENFEVPAFIAPSTAYVDSIDVKASSINQYGAYKLAASETLTITTDSVGTVSVIMYALGESRSIVITNSADVTALTNGTISNYENRGVVVSQTINVANETTPTEIYITNNGLGDVYISYISLSEVGSAALDEQTVYCK